MALQEVRWEGSIDWIDLAQNRDSAPGIYLFISQSRGRGHSSAVLDTCDGEDPRDYTFGKETLVVPLVAPNFIWKCLDFNRLKTTSNVNYT